MDGQQTQANPLETLLLLNQISDTYKSFATNISASRSIDFGRVIDFELTETEDKTPIALLTYSDGALIEISPEDFKTYFRPFWNIKTKVDSIKFAYATALFNQMFPENEKR